MVDLRVHNAIIFNKEKATVDIIDEYLKNQSVTIKLNHFEGPCCRSLGLYDMLDLICDKFKINKSDITIVTNNVEEKHSEYTIIIENALKWLQLNVSDTLTAGYAKAEFKNKKDVTKNLFGCLYNKPSYPRLCLLNYIYRNTRSSSLTGCNVNFIEGLAETVDLNKLSIEARDEFDQVLDFLNNSGIKVLPDHPGFTPNESHINYSIIKFYNEFFIDLVSETYFSGSVFSLTEKTIRPMLAMTPFIIHGPTAYISNLKNRYGFKTFDHWWNEDYDWTNEYQRVKEIYKIIDQLNRLSDADRISMYEDMQDTLEHNYFRVMELFNK